MASSTLALLTAASALSGTELFYVDQSGDRKATATQIKTFVIGTGSASIASGKTLTVSNSLTLAGTDGQTMTFPAVSDTLAGLGTANTFTAQNTFAAGTITASAPHTWTGTWNNTTQFIGLKANFVPGGSAPASSSLLMQLQYNTTDILTLRKDGFMILGGAVAAISANGIGIAVSGTGILGLTIDGGTLRIGASLDAILARDAAGIFAQRNGVNAQAFRVYGTFTDASNYERGALNTGSDYIELAAETAGTGDDDLDVRLTPAGVGKVRFGAHSALAAEALSGYITIKDAGGTSRKVAVIS